MHNTRTYTHTHTHTRTHTHTPVGASADIIDLEFLPRALAELIRSRHVLKASYPYHHSIASDHSQERQELLRLVHELEKETEGLSSMVAKSHLCHRRHDIMSATHTVLNKRKGLLSEVPNLQKLPKEWVSLVCTLSACAHQLCRNVCVCVCV